MRRALIVIGVAMLSGCGGDTATTPTTSETTLRAAADRLEAEYPRILAELGLSSLPVITVRIWQDETIYFNELTRYFGVRYQRAATSPGRRSCAYWASLTFLGTWCMSSCTPRAWP